MAEIVRLSWKALEGRACALARRERGSSRLDPAALLSELYLRLHALRSVRWQNPEHFVAFAAQLMRQILIDHARSRGRLKRSVKEQFLHQEEPRSGPEIGPEALALRQALDSLARRQPRLAQVLRCRYIEGRTTRETALACGTSVATVKRDCEQARAWMLQVLSAS